MLERHERLEHRGAADRVPGVLRTLGRVDLHLPLAVIAEPRGLEHGGRPDPRQPLAQAREAVDRRPFRGPATDALDEPLLADPLLRHPQGARARMHGDAVGEPFDRLDRNILEFVGHHVAGIGKVGEHDTVVIIGARHRRGGLRGDAFLVGGEHMRVIAELRCGGREHPAELTSAKDTNGRSGGKRRHVGVFQAGLVATESVCAARQAFSRSASASSAVARIAAASSPALIAPGLPIASVPTGMPPGI
jgi:hypothetical protein